MSASPGAYLTSIQPGVWYQISDREWILPVFINATITSNQTYGPYVSPIPLQTLDEVVLTVTAVSGTSPTLTISSNAYDVVAALNGVYEGGWGGTWISNVSAPGTYPFAWTNGYLGVFTINVTVGGTSPSFTATLTLYIMA